MDELAGQYRIGTELGRGASGIVYRAVRASDNAPVAVKLLDSSQNDDLQMLDRFRLEAKNGSRIVHPNAVRILDSGQDGKRAFLVMELLNGVTLSQAIDAGGPMSEKRVAEIGVAVASALAAAHAVNFTLTKS